MEVGESGSQPAHSQQATDAGLLPIPLDGIHQAGDAVNLGSEVDLEAVLFHGELVTGPMEATLHPSGSGTTRAMK